MALTEAEKVTVAEITRETYATIDSLASSLNASQETVVIADTVTWAANRNKVAVEIEGGRSGVGLKKSRLLEAIRERVRKALGLPLYSPEVYGTSQSIPTVGRF
jgi:hypothetical protein